MPKSYPQRHQRRASSGLTAVNCVTGHVVGAPQIKIGALRVGGERPRIQGIASDGPRWGLTSRRSWLFAERFMLLRRAESRNSYDKQRPRSVKPAARCCYPTRP